MSRPTADAACIGHSMDGSKPQRHNAMCHIIFSTINAPVSALRTREAIDIKTASAANQKG